MKKEYYKRFVIKEVYLATEEDKVVNSMNLAISDWVNKLTELPLAKNLNYRIINAETQMINASEWAGQKLPPTIRYVVHIAYTL